MLHFHQGLISEPALLKQFFYQSVHETNDSKYQKRSDYLLILFRLTLVVHLPVPAYFEHLSTTFDCAPLPKEHHNIISALGLSTILMGFVLSQNR